MKKVISIIIIAAVFVLGGYASINVVKANPTFAPVTVQTATATSTITYMSPGVATTTLTLDTYSSGNPRLAYNATLLIQFVGTSTASILNTNIQYSQDGIDWYQDGGSLTNNFATTTKPFDIGQVNTFNYTFSSTSPSLGAAISATSTRAVRVNTPTRYVRALFTMPIGSANGAIWAQFVPIKEVAE